MAKLTLDLITADYGSKTLFNDNMSLIEAFAETVLSRDGTSPNQMEADLDMNSNSINNVADLTAVNTTTTNLTVTGTLVVDGIDYTAVAAAAAASAAAAAASAAAALASENAAALSEANAATSETNAAASAAAASTSETNAAASAAAAATSETNAATSETNAAASAASASTSASNAATSEANAATSETNAAASYDSFDDRYLGAKASDPTLDNDGDPLLTGALYWNTTAGELRVYDGAAWQTSVYPDTTYALKAADETITGHWTFSDEVVINSVNSADQVRFYNYYDVNDSTVLGYKNVGGVHWPYIRVGGSGAYSGFLIEGVADANILKVTDAGVMTIGPSSYTVWTDDNLDLTPYAELAQDDTITGQWDFNRLTRVTGTGAAPTSGDGMELYYSAGQGTIFCYDRTTSAYKATLIAGQDLTLWGIGTGDVVLTTTAGNITADSPFITDSHVYGNKSSGWNLHMGYDPVTATNNTGPHGFYFYDNSGTTGVPELGMLYRTSPHRLEWEDVNGNDLMQLLVTPATSYFRFLTQDVYLQPGSGRVTLKGDNTGTACDAHILFTYSDDTNLFYIGTSGGNSDVYGGVSYQSGSDMLYRVNNGYMKQSLDGGTSWRDINTTPREVRAHRNGSNQSIPNATLTPIVWTTTVSDPEDFIDTTGAGSSSIIIPSGSGIKEVQFTVQICFAADATATGDRYAMITKNGSTTYAMRPISVKRTISTSTEYIQFTSGPISCTDNDVFKVEAYQNSGGSLNVVGNNHNTHVSMWVVESDS